MVATLQDVLEETSGTGRGLVEVNPGPGEQLATVLDHFERFGVSVTDRITHDGLPESTLVLTDGDRCLGAVDVGELHDYLSEYGVETRPPPDVTASVQAFLARLDDGVYTVESASKRRMTGVSRHVEVAIAGQTAGTVHAGFQRLSVLGADGDTLRVYETVADRGVDVALYGRPDWSPPDDAGFEVYADDDGDVVGDFWFVVYDGPDPEEGAAVLAREVAPGRYDGFWTFDAERVRPVVDCLEHDVQPQLTRLVPDA